MSGAFCAVTGRAARDGEHKTAASGKGYAVVTLAVDIEERRDGETSTSPPAWWVRVMAFGRSADCLAAVRKGEVLHAAGRLERGRYEARDGGERESWTLLADSVIAARPASNRGASRPANGGGDRTRARRAAPPPREDEPPLTEDDIPF